MLGPLCLSLLLGAAQEDLPASWKAVASTEGRFTVAMPGEPMQRTQTVKTATGQLTVNLLVVEGRNDSVFVVSYSDLPEADLKKGSVAKRLDHARDGAVTSARGKLRSEKAITLNTHPGREVVVEKEGEVVARMRIYLVERRLYQVMVLGTGPVFATPEVGLFLDSFRLNK